MTKTVLDAGNCDADHASLRAMLDANFQVALLHAHSADEALNLLRANDVDLLLVNRQLDLDHSDGLEIIKRVKADADLAATPCLLISNFEEAQQRAVAAGAEVGFGKRQLHSAETIETLTTILDR